MQALKRVNYPWSHDVYADMNKHAAPLAYSF